MKLTANVCSGVAIALSMFSLATSSAEAVCNADVNGDTFVNFQDLAMVSDCYEGITPPNPACDVNDDGVIGIADLEIIYCWAGLLGGPPLGALCCTEVRACCTGDLCVDKTPAECLALGGTSLPLGSNCAGLPVSVVEPGGNIFVHQVTPPVECPLVVQPAPRGQPCDFGEFFLDPWTTTSGQSCHNFLGTPQSPAIPADFFAPGSQPFLGQVCFQGVPSGNPFFPDADTIIRRVSQVGDFCEVDGAPTMQIMIEELSLASVTPISVVVNGNPEAWDVAVDLSEVPAPLGTITTTRTHCNGGKYLSTLHVQPRFTFTKVSDPGQVRVLDTGLEGIPPVTLNPTDPKDYSIDLPPGIDGANYCSSFHPGFRSDVPVSCDCNENGIRDACDIANGTVSDVNGNGIPDTCETIAAPIVAPQPVTFTLIPATPNPMRFKTTLMFAVSRDQRVSMTIHDVRGRVVRTLLDGAQSMGPHSVEWDGKDQAGLLVSPSVYYAKLVCDEGTRSTRIAVIR